MLVGKDTSKTQLQVDPYSKKTLHNFHNEELRKGRGDGQRFEYEHEWRMLPRQLDKRECMVICSGGDCFAPSVDVAPKLQDTSMVDTGLQLLRKELDVVQEKMREGVDYYLVHVCQDFPGAQMTKYYYLEKIKQLMTKCEQPGGRHHM